MLITESRMEMRMVHRRLAGGLGSRLRPVISVLQLLVELMKIAGFYDILFVWFKMYTNV